MNLCHSLAKNLHFFRCERHHRLEVEAVAKELVGPGQYQRGTLATIAFHRIEDLKHALLPLGADGVLPLVHGHQVEFTLFLMVDHAQAAATAAAFAGVFTRAEKRCWW